MISLTSQLEAGKAVFDVIDLRSLSERDLRRAERLVAELRRRFGAKEEDVRIVKSPYRIAPLGAHVDHQLGRVTGMAIDRSTLLAFVPNPSGRVRLESLNFPGRVEFDLREVPPPQNGDWGNYARGAAVALKSHYRIEVGIDGVLEGNMPIGGLSSSASVGLAYLLALEHVNGLKVLAKDNIALDKDIENGYIGLNNGILDQSSILLARRENLMYLDCLTEDYQLHAVPEVMGEFEFVVVYSGVTKNLVGTGYNQRVAECQEAARRLLQMAGLPLPERPVLRHVPEDVFEQKLDELPEMLAKRARHFHTENRRVLEGIEAWRRGDLHTFGRLMSESGRSSIENYECGSPPLIALYEILVSTDGVFGARFSGAGFRGNCIGLIDPAFREAVRLRVLDEYPRRFPEYASQLSVTFCKMDDGLRLL
jgi:galactokinase